MSTRPDQLRDKDAIQRDADSSESLQRGVQFAINTSRNPKTKMMTVSLHFLEPNGSENAGSSKFVFYVEDKSYEAAFNAMGQILEDTSGSPFDAPQQNIEKLYGPKFAAEADAYGKSGQSTEAPKS